MPTQRVSHTDTASGGEAAKRGNGEFQVNACVSMLTAGSLSSPLKTILRGIQEGTVKKHICLPFHNKILGLLSVCDRYSSTQDTMRCPVLPLVQAPIGNERAA